MFLPRRPSFRGIRRFVFDKRTELRGRLKDLNFPETIPFTKHKTSNSRESRFSTLYIKKRKESEGYFVEQGKTKFRTFEGKNTYLPNSI